MNGRVALSTCASLAPSVLLLAGFSERLLPARTFRVCRRSTRSTARLSKRPRGNPATGRNESRSLEGVCPGQSTVLLTLRVRETSPGTVEHRRDVLVGMVGVTSREVSPEFSWNRGGRQGHRGRHGDFQIHMRSGVSYARWRQSFSCREFPLPTCCSASSASSAVNNPAQLTTSRRRLRQSQST